ncbi:hypothetical protein B5F40_01050 [Gordonibacter sp. An230]|uniref:PspC domain-containing protein n=1 Tax=Gordonibacter sp. An230 TaxID=1965592 RepID=UPI000B3ADA0C|nr:PspC domain-containing protein [Gordonibacter sp. An230]OUO92512.1 hypothetical protein B5F40_01050 [Gordonibacter sp. An230]
MTQEKRLYRSRDALLGGVCAGVAEYFDVDPVVTRILAVVFAIASAGVLGVAYVAMWAVLPKEPEKVAPVEVEPQSVRSETYGEVDASVARGRADQGTDAQEMSPAQLAAWRYTSAAHVSPPPPPAVISAGAMPPAGGGVAGAMPYSVTPSQPTGAPTAPVGAPPQPVAAPTGPVSPPKEPSAAAVKGALWLGSFLLFFGVTSLVVTFVEGVSWWQYWPLIFVILGIVRMVVPAKPGRRARHFVGGLVCFCVGGTLLPMSLGVAGWQSLGLMLVGLWPVLLMVAGLFILGCALKSPLLTLLAGAFFAAFCVAGLVWYAVPGATEQIVISAPYGRSYYIDILPWLD